MFTVLLVGNKIYKLFTIGLVCGRELMRRGSILTFNKKCGNIYIYISPFIISYFLLKVNFFVQNLKIF